MTFDFKTSPAFETEAAAAAARAAERVSLVWVPDPVTLELYGEVVGVLDEAATLRRVAVFYRGTSAYKWTPAEKDAALRVIRARADR